VSKTDYYDLVEEILEAIDSEWIEVENIEPNHSIISTENGEVEYEKYVRYDIRYFAFDKDNIYINFYFYNSLDGHLTLKISKEYCPWIANSLK